MIKLDVQEYCHGCANFTADVKEPEKYYAGFDIIEMTDTLIDHAKNFNKEFGVYVEKENDYAENQ